jgi:cysteine desulfurase/selenocysteine lyase
MAPPRQDFPFLQRRINGRSIIYFDNAATTQKPRQVIDALCDYYANHCANIHRGTHTLSQEATDLYEQARGTVARILGCEDREVVFVRNATDGINLIARSLHRSGDILVPASEHHSNLLPWRQHHNVRHVQITAGGRIDLDDLRRHLRAGAALVALAHVGNVLGAANPVREVVDLASAHGALTLVDASQSAGHVPLDVRALGCDFLVFSGHKMFAPSGIGVLYARIDLLEEMIPRALGGGTVKEVTLDGHTPQDIPWRFEPGTPNVEGAIALAAAIDYIEDLGFDWITTHERGLLAHVLEAFRRVPGAVVHGPQMVEDKLCGPVAFSLKRLEAQMVARVLNDRQNVMVRAGYHCAHPLHTALGLEPTVRVSFSVYNTEQEVDAMNEVLRGLQRYA